MIHRLRQIGSVAVVAIVLGWPAFGFAQTATEARADALFNEGKQLREKGQYPEACSKFAQSKELAPGVGISLHLADCYERVGRTAGAWREFRAAEKLASERSDKRAEVAQARAQALESKLDRSTMESAPADGEGAQVAPPLPAPAAASVPSVLPNPAPPSTAASPMDTGAHVDDYAARRGASYGLVGAGFLGVGVGAVLLAANTPSAPAGVRADQVRPDPDMTMGAAIAFAAGGVALVSAFVLYFTTPHRKSAKDAVLAISPALLPGGAGGFLKATF